MEANNVIERLREEIACLRKSNEEMFVTISKQDAEIKKLKAVADAELDTIHNLGDDYTRVLEEMQKVVEKAKVDAIREFAKRLKQMPSVTNCETEWFCLDIDNLVKEMTEQSVNYESSKRMEGENENH